MKKEKIKAIGLFSGGLDSMIAIKLIEEQGVEVLAVNFVSSFFGNKEKLKKVAQENNIKLKIIDVSKEYLEKVVKRPKHGYGKNMNPCIDCKIFMLRTAHKIMKKEKAKFVFTGEVLGQRPMSQRNTPLQQIKKESTLGDKLVRPLSAKLLPRSEAEDKGWINRERLLDIDGRNRKRQMELARKYNLKDFGSPSGGCLLTEAGYSNKLRDLLKHNKRAKLYEVSLLRLGRNFRFSGAKIVVGKNEQDNNKIMKVSKPEDLLFQIDGGKGPVVLLRGPKKKEFIEEAASLAVRYSGTPDIVANIKYGKGFKKSIKAERMNEKDIKEALLT